MVVLYGGGAHTSEEYVGMTASPENDPAGIAEKNEKERTGGEGVSILGQLLGTFCS